MNNANSTPILRAEPLERHTILLERSLWNAASNIGNGNASAGVRFLIRQAVQQQRTGSAQADA